MLANKCYRDKHLHTLYSLCAPRFDYSREFNCTQYSYRMYMHMHHAWLVLLRPNKMTKTIFLIEMLIMLIFVHTILRVFFYYNGYASTLIFVFSFYTFCLLKIKGKSDVDSISSDLDEKETLISSFQSTRKKNSDSQL